jgi:hypothetical protein
MEGISFIAVREIGNREIGFLKRRKAEEIEKNHRPRV